MVGSALLAAFSSKIRDRVHITLAQGIQPSATWYYCSRRTDPRRLHCTVDLEAHSSNLSLSKRVPKCPLLRCRASTTSLIEATESSNVMPDSAEEKERKKIRVEFSQVATFLFWPCNIPVVPRGKELTDPRTPLDRPRWIKTLHFGEINVKLSKHARMSLYEWTPQEAWVAINQIKSGLCWCGVFSINNTRDYII